MEQLRIVRMKSKVSLVVWLRDSFRSGPPVDRELTVRLDGYPRKPIGKPDGTYIFNDLEPGAYRLEIGSTYYFRESRYVSVGSANEIVHIPLLPIPSYPYGHDDTLIRGMLVDSSGSPVPDADITAVVASEECARARLADDKTPEGAAEIAVAFASGDLQAGDMLQLVGRGAKEVREIVTIAETLEYRKRLRLESPLASAFSRGSLLLPVYRTRTTAKGEMAIAFPGGAASLFRVELRSGDGVSGRVMELDVAEGRTTNAGKWIVAG